MRSGGALRTPSRLIQVLGCIQFPVAAGLGLLNAVSWGRPELLPQVPLSLSESSLRSNPSQVSLACLHPEKTQLQEDHQSGQATRTVSPS